MLYLLEELNAKKWSLRVIIPSGRALEFYDKFLYDPKSLIFNLSKLADEYLLNNFKIILKGDIIGILIKIKNKSIIKKSETLYPCQYLKRSLYISANGDIKGCGISKTANNIYNSNIKEIWESLEMRKIKNTKIDVLCVSCKFSQIGICKPYKFICPSASCNYIIKELLINLLNYIET